MGQSEGHFTELSEHQGRANLEDKETTENTP